jgi:hypothetical protein
LAGISISEDVTNIDQSAFSGCTNLTDVAFPVSVAYIASDAFLNCTSLSNAYFKGDAPLVDWRTAFTRFVGDGGHAPISTIWYLPGTIGWDTAFFNVASPWAPQIQASDGGFGVQSNQFRFNIIAATNIPVVVVEASTNLAGEMWLSVSTNMLSDGTSYFSDPQWTNYPVRFYRLSMP